MVKDMPASEDPFYLHEFRARRRREKAVEAQRQQDELVVDTDKSNAEKRLEAIRALFQQESLDSMQKIQSTLKALEQLSPKDKHEL